MGSARASAGVLGLALLLGGAPARTDGPAADPAAGSGGGCAEALARRVQEHYEAVRDLSADFEQESRYATLGAGPAAAGGTVVFAKPGRMRWAYERPEPSLVVSDGATLWTYDPGLREAQRLPVTGGLLSGVAMQFLLGEGRILETHRVRAGACEGERVTLELLPREPASYERLELAVEPASGQVVETLVVDLFGNATRVAFRRIRINRDPDPALFRFEPPEGVRVLELPAAP